MAEQVDRFDWSQTPLGPMAGWPESLRTSVGICLGSQLPMFVWWGPELINIYNDAYAPVLGARHPAALGQPAREIWADIWLEIGTDVDRVIHDGQCVKKERVRFVMERNGYPEETFFTYSHSPIPDGNGGIGGLFQVCTDETSRVLAERDRERLARQRQEAEELAQSILDSVTDGFFALNRDWRFSYANAQAGRILGRSTAELIGKSLWEEYPGLCGSVFEPVYRRAMDERAPGALTSFYPDHDCWYDVRCYPSQQGISIYFQNIDELKRSEAVREALARTVENERSRLRAVIEQAPAIICMLRGPEHRLEFTNELYLQLIGKRDVIGKTVAEVVPEVESQGYIAMLDQVYRTGKPFRGTEMPVLLRRTETEAMETRFVDFVFQPLREADGGVSGVFVHGVDLTETVTARAQVQEREARFRNLADAMPQIVWSAGPDGTLNYYNRRWYEYINLPQSAGDEAVWDKYVHPDDLPRAAAEWSNCVASGNYYNIEFRVRNCDGVYRWFLVRALPARDDSGTITHWFGTCTDIEDRRRFEAEREQLLSSERAARAESDRAGRMKDEFLATLSHELRTPLNAILGWSQIIQRSSDQQDIVEGLAIIERNARAQSQIIEDLLDMSRIISGKVRLDVQRVDISAIVKAAVDTAKPTAEAKGVRLSSVLDPLHGVIVSGDANRLQQVLWNLLANAIKFTPKGGRVQVVLERVNSHLEVSVIDSGEGIQLEFLPYVFDRFRQADASITRRHGGLGLGLSIVKQLIELHGGSVRVKSAGQGLGATFTIALPLVAVQAPLEPEAERRHPRLTPTLTGMADTCLELKGVRVLVVDDEPDARALVRRLLEDCEAVVASAGSAKEAIALLEANRFDVLVSDIGMPDADGYELINWVRALGIAKGGNIPAIALTAYARTEDRVKAIAAGFQMHVVKPVEPVELVTMVAGAAGRIGRSVD
jgi:PAS domain S-box-containing protein